METNEIPLDRECEPEHTWNAQADKYNQWRDLSEQERADWVLVTRVIRLASSKPG